MTENASHFHLNEVLLHYTKTIEEPWEIQAQKGGLIHQTYFLHTSKKDYIMQKVSPIFPSAVHEDIDYLTNFLCKNKWQTPLLVRNDKKQLFTTLTNGEIYRLYEAVAGITYDTFPNKHMLYEAGKLVGRFHFATRDLGYVFQHKRAHVHDVPFHLAHLQKTIEAHPGHAFYEPAVKMEESVRNRLQKIPSISHAPLRVTHGDLKASNLLFDRTTHTGICLVDLDTMGRMPLHLEMGDAFRSWCNPKGEDTPHTYFDLDYFTHALNGYMQATAGMLTHEEATNFLVGVSWVSLGLALRFAADMLTSCYFAFNPLLFKDRSSHNLVRAQGQLHLFDSIQAQKKEAEETLERAWRSRLIQKGS